MSRYATPTAKFAIILIVFSVLLAACGGNSSSGSSASGDSGAAASSDSGVTPLPTMPIPKENFKAHSENQITQTISVSSTQPASQTQATTTTTSASADDLARGNRSYTKNKCADCHGDKGEVVAGKTTKAIGGTTLTLDQFDQFLRTGGGLGDTHIFGPGAISPGGMQALYAYVKSLPGK
ncbi:MAG: hypothetical protein U0350_09565 [Caldilineaceae bacterium]